jgi:hypothetical protein
MAHIKCVYTVWSLLDVQTIYWLWNTLGDRNMLCVICGLGKGIK